MEKMKSFKQYTESVDTIHDVERWAIVECGIDARFPWSVGFAFQTQSSAFILKHFSQFSVITHMIDYFGNCGRFIDSSINERLGKNEYIEEVESAFDNAGVLPDIKSNVYAYGTNNFTDPMLAHKLNNMDVWGFQQETEEASSFVYSIDFLIPLGINCTEESVMKQLVDVNVRKNTNPLYNKYSKPRVWKK